MLKTVQRCQRYSVESLKIVDLATKRAQTDPLGRLFALDRRMVDLSRVKFLHAGIDTVRQLYHGTPKAGLILQLDAALEEEEPIFYLKDNPFSLSKMGMKSGFRYKLQNNALGLIILLGSYYTKLDQPGTHLKIEVSPHLIAQAGESLTRMLHRVAEFCMDIDLRPSGVALHLACDIQGWTPPRDFVDRFVTRTRTLRQFFGISKSEFNLSEVAAVYGNAESFTFGRADSLQVCIYRKDLEAIKRDKLDYWKAVWGDEYNPDFPVYRIEVRFHHNVLAELGNSIAKGELSTARDWLKYLPELWTYAFENNRLECRTNHMDPAWQLIQEDAFRSRCVMPLKRIKKASGQAVGRNIANFVGNAISLYARQNKSMPNLWNYLKKSHIWPLITDYYRDRGYTLAHLYESIQRAMLQRHLIGKAA